MPDAEKTTTIFCVVHGYTHWEHSLIRLINTPEFQRLKKIKQLAAVHHVFPSATHTRFEHSLGVGHLAERFAKCLLSKQPDLLINPFVFKLAGLCHDLGHGPLSHVFDRTNTGRSHEERSCQRLIDIVKTYEIDILEEFVACACELICPQTHSFDDYMYQIICNNIDEIDVDKMDYLARDAHYTGMPFKIDFDRFFSYSKVLNKRICYSKKSMQHAINHLFLTRHQMHCQVYQHPVVRAFEMMYSNFFELVCTNDDWECTDEIISDLFLKCRFSTGCFDAQTFEKASRIVKDISLRKIPKFLSEKKLEDKEYYERSMLKIDGEKEVKDIVKIGYKKHPLLRVTFFDTDGNIQKLDERELLSIYPMEQMDVIERIYHPFCFQD